MATGLSNLKIYQMAKQLELRVYRMTQQFPREERYRTVDQLQRSSAAVTNNIAEAYNKQSSKDKIHILRDIVISEAEETESNVLRCAEKELLARRDAEKTAAGYVELKKATNGYIRFLRDRAGLDTRSTSQLAN